MGINLGTTSIDVGVDSKDWLASMKGFDTCRSVTLDMSLFPAATYPNGYVPSGTPIAKVTATGLFGPYIRGNSDGLDIAQGHLLNEVRVSRDNQPLLGKVGAAMLWEGIVLLSKLPVFVGTDGELDANGQADCKFIRYEA